MSGFAAGGVVRIKNNAKQKPNVGADLETPRPSRRGKNVKEPDFSRRFLSRTHYIGGELPAVGIHYS
jgi:hypothetical protein